MRLEERTGQGAGHAPLSELNDVHPVRWCY